MQTIGRYEVVSVIGDGAMGTVYRGRDPQLDAPVAIKVIHEHLARDAATLERFKNEAVIQARLRHPNIVAVHDFLLDGTRAAIVMEYVEGKSLDEVLSEETGPMPYGRCLEVMRQVLSGVGHAHRLGIVHRDLKPSNLIVQWYGSEMHVKITDFGIAKILGDEKRRTGTHAKMGTLLYMSPEQIRSPREVDCRADIYSLGCTLYEMSTGVTPFDSDTEYDVMTAILTREPPPPHASYPHVGGRLEAVIGRAMAKDPAARYQSCEEFLNDLVAAGPVAVAEPAPASVVAPVGAPAPVGAVGGPSTAGPGPVLEGESGTASGAAVPARRTGFPVAGWVVVAAVVLVGGGLVTYRLSQRTKEVQAIPSSNRSIPGSGTTYAPPERRDLAAGHQAGRPNPNMSDRPTLTGRTCAFGNTTVSMSVPSQWRPDDRLHRDFPPDQPGRYRERETVRGEGASVWVEYVNVAPNDLMGTPSEFDATWLAKGYHDYSRILLTRTTIHGRDCVKWVFRLRDPSSGVLERKALYYFSTGGGSLTLGFVAPDQTFDALDARYFQSSLAGFSYN